MYHFPITTCRGDGARVPPVPVYSSSSGITSQNLLSGSDLVGPSTSQNEIPSKRGRPSTIPREIREETRRLKKQNMERRRRASISDKMNALHSLAMELIGINPDESQKLEKVDMLSLCYTVLELVANIAKDKPELQARLRKLRHSLYDVTSSSPTSNDIPSSASSSSSSTSRSTSATKKLDKFTKSLHKVAIAATATAESRKRDYAFVTNKLSEEEEYSVVNTNSSSEITRILPSSFFQSNADTTTTANPNTTNTSTATTTANIPQSTQLVIDEDNKENKIPKLIIKNAFWNKSCSVMKNITTNTVTTPPTIPFSYVHNSSSKSTPLPSKSSSS
ncbi:unnamed protein product [Trichobilharzia szidati]|nr:unnamed protein product [Trichobilharzia szidati]